MGQASPFDVVWRARYDRDVIPLRDQTPDSYTNGPVGLPLQPHITTT